MKTPYSLILASTSKYRAALLEQLGWDFRSVAPGVDEDKVKEQNLAPIDLALSLSQMKAHAVFARFTNSCVIGSDQVCCLGKTILSKPMTKERAYEQLSLMQGRSHDLITAVTIITPQEIQSFHNITTLHMRPLNTEEIKTYVDLDLPLDCAGSYKLESRGIKLFDKITMTDHTAIIGLPLVELTNHLMRIGFPF